MAASKATGARFVFLCQDVFPEVARLLEDFQNKRVEAVLSKVGSYTVAGPTASSRSATR